MRKLFVTTLIAMVALILIAPRFVRWTITRASVPTGTFGLRLAVLQHKIADSSAITDSSDVQCVVMDWNMGGGTIATLVAFADGRTSFYLSPGKVIDAGGRESVREAAARFRAAALEKPDWFMKTADFDPPANGKMRFFLVTPAATIGTRAELSVVLANKTQSLHALAEAGQATIAAIQRPK